MLMACRVFQVCVVQNGLLLVTWSFARDLALNLPPVHYGNTWARPFTRVFTSVLPLILHGLNS